MIFANDEFDRIERDLQVLRALGVKAAREDVEEITKAANKRDEAEALANLLHEYRLMFEGASLEVERLQKALLCVSVVAACLAAALIVRIVMF